MDIKFQLINLHLLNNKSYLRKEGLVSAPFPKTGDYNQIYLY